MQLVYANSVEMSKEIFGEQILQRLPKIFPLKKEKPYNKELFRSISYNIVSIGLSILYFLSYTPYESATGSSLFPYVLRTDMSLLISTL